MTAPLDPCPQCARGSVCSSYGCGRKWSSETMELYGMPTKIELPPLPEPKDEPMLRDHPYFPSEVVRSYAVHAIQQDRERRALTAVPADKRERMAFYEEAMRDPKNHAALALEMAYLRSKADAAGVHHELNTTPLEHQKGPEMTDNAPHPQGNGKPGDVAKSEREKFEACYTERSRRKYPNASMDGMRSGDSYANRTAAACWDMWQTRAALAATPQPAIPPGFKVVEPTDEMIEAAVQAAWQEERTRISRRVMCDAIKAALSAAPVPEAGQGVSETKQRLRTVPAQFFIDMDSAMRHVECFGSDDAKAVVSTIRNIGAMWLSPAPAQAQAQAQAPVEVSGETLAQIVEQLQIMLGSAKQHSDGDAVTGYTIKTGALHRILGILCGAGYPVTVPLMPAASPVARVEVTAAGWAQLFVHGVHLGSGYGQEEKDRLDAKAAELNAACAASPPPQSAQLIEPKPEVQGENHE